MDVDPGGNRFFRIALVNSLMLFPIPGGCVAALPRGGVSHHLRPLRGLPNDR